MLCVDYFKTRLNARIEASTGQLSVVIKSDRAILNESKAMSAIPDEISEETAEALLAQAKARGLSVDDYLKSLLGVAGQRSVTQPTVEEFEADMKALAEKNLPPLPPDFLREDIYFDHD